MNISRSMKLGAAAVAGILVVVLAGECRDWLSKKPKVTYYPQTGQLTAEAELWPSSTQPVELQLPDLPEGEVDRIGKKYDRTDLAGGSRKPDLGKAPDASSGESSPASGPAGRVAGGVAGGGGGYVEGSIRRGARTITEWTFTSEDGECSIDVAAFLEATGAVTSKGIWKNTPADNPEETFIEAPLRWRLTVGGTAWPRATTFAALGFRTLRVNRIELSPAVMAGYDFTTEGAEPWAGVGAVGTFDF